QYHNPFHFHEFTQEEFSSFLSEYYADVRILCQRVYPGSYIWEPDRPAKCCSEYQIGLVDGRFRPITVDRKERLYFIALCSNGASADPGNSLLVDLDEFAIREGSWLGQLST